MEVELSLGTAITQPEPRLGHDSKREREAWLRVMLHVQAVFESFLLSLLSSGQSGAHYCELVCVCSSLLTSLTLRATM